MITKHGRSWAIGLIIISVCCGCSSPTINKDPLPVRAAKQEMRHRGWKQIEVERCVFRDGTWVVDLYKPKFKGGVNFASVKVSPEGTVLDVFENLK
jgi:hypothetical protein